MSKDIPLTQGKFAIVDDEDYDRLMRYKWCVIGSRYAATRPMKDGHQITIYMHRLIISAPSDKQVDHINGNGLDNRRSNLRLCSNSENHMNVGLSSRSISGYKGVRIRPDCKTKKFDAHIYVDGKHITIGYFSTIEEAAIAYNEAATKYFGEFAKLNNI